MRARFFTIWAALAFLLGAANAGAAEGVVRDGKTGAPVAGASVGAGNETALTDKDGHFRIDAAGVLRVRAPGYLAAQADPGAGMVLRLTPFMPRALYLTSQGIAEPSLRDGALRLIRAGKANALVIDIKDDYGRVVYPSRAPAAAGVEARSLTTIPDLPALVKSLRREGIYAIARIVVFKDEPFASSHPELAVKAGDRLYRDREGMAWTDPFRRAGWAYNIAVAREAAEAGFDEVQFDYVRFPDDEAPLGFAQPSTRDSRVEAISGFLAAARQELAPFNVFTSADVFGYVCWNTTDTGIGQDLAAIAGTVDYVAPMLYPSGFHAGIPGYRDPVANAYQVIYLSLVSARTRLGIPAIRFRPWLQAFRDYAFDHRTFDGPLVNEQIRAARDFGADGWMLWNASNRYEMLNGPEVPVAADGCPATPAGKAG